MKRELLKKKAMLVSLSSVLAVAHPTVVQADIDKDAVKNYVKEKASSALDWSAGVANTLDGYAENPDVLVDDAKNLAGKAKNKAGEIKDETVQKVKNFVAVKPEDIRVITTMPSVDPSEERDYFFVKSEPSVNKKYYLNQYGDEVDKEDPYVYYEVLESTYKDLLKEHDPFVYQIYRNCQTNEKISNTILLSEDQVYNADAMDYVYGYFNDVSLFASSEYYFYEKWDKDVLEMLSNEINDVSYQIGDGQGLVKKQ